MNTNRIDEIIGNTNLSVNQIISELKKLKIKVSGEELREMRNDFSKCTEARQLTSYYEWISYGLIGKKEFTNANLVNVVNKINSLI